MITVASGLIIILSIGCFQSSKGQRYPGYRPSPNNNKDRCELYTDKPRQDYCQMYKDFCNTEAAEKSNPQLCIEVPKYCRCPKIEKVKVEKYPQELLLDLHNAYRKKVANGQAGQPGGYIPGMTWNQDLAEKAYKWAKQCNQGFDPRKPDYAHNPDKKFFDKKTNQILTTGENWAGRSDYAIVKMFEAWFNESFKFDYHNNRAIGGAVVGHYTQIVWDDSVQLGCGLAECPDSGLKYSLICNYLLVGNMQGKKPYQATKAEHDKVCCEGHKKYCTEPILEDNKPFCARQAFCNCGGKANGNVQPRPNVQPPPNPEKPRRPVPPVGPRPTVRPVRRNPRPQPESTGNQGNNKPAITAFDVVLDEGVAKITCRAKQAPIYLYKEADARNHVKDSKTNTLYYEEEKIDFSRTNAWKCVVKGSNQAVRDEVVFTLKPAYGAEGKHEFSRNPLVGQRTGSSSKLQGGRGYNGNKINELKRNPGYVCRSNTCYPKNESKFEYTLKRRI